MLADIAAGLRYLRAAPAAVGGLCARTLLRRLQSLVHSLWVLEVVNVLTLAERGKRLLPAETAHLFEPYSSLTITSEVMPVSTGKCGTLLSLCRDHGLRAYGARYLRTAMRYAASLAARDEALRAACRRSGVTVFAIR